MALQREIWRRPEKGRGLSPRRRLDESNKVREEAARRAQEEAARRAQPSQGTDWIDRIIHTGNVKPVRMPQPTVQASPLRPAGAVRGPQEDTAELKMRRRQTDMLQETLRRRRLQDTPAATVKKPKSRLDEIAEQVLSTQTKADRYKDPFLRGFDDVSDDQWRTMVKNEKMELFKKTAGLHADKIFSGEWKPAKPYDESDPEQQGSNLEGMLAEPFLQGLFGEKELKDQFINEQAKAVEPKLNEYLKTLFGKKPGMVADSVKSGYNQGKNTIPGNTQLLSAARPQQGAQANGQKLPEAFDSLDDLKKLIPGGIGKSLFDLGITQDAWNSMSRAEQEAVLSPWVQGSDYKLSEDDQKLVDNTRTFVHEFMTGDPERRSALLEGIGYFSTAAQAAQFLSQPMTNETAQQVGAAFLRKAFEDSSFDGELPADRLAEISRLANAVVGMQVDENGVWHSTGTGIANTEGGYSDAMDQFAKNVLGFDLKSDTVTFNANGNDNRDHEYELRGWSGGYGSLFGGEFGLYEKSGDGDWAKVDEDRFNIELTAKDKQGHELFNYNAGDEKFWQYAAMHPNDIEPLLKQNGYSEQDASNIAHKLKAGDIVVEGRLTGKDKDDVPYLQAMTNAIQEKNKKKAQDGIWNPFGYLMTESEQIKAMNSGYMEDGKPYVTISLNAPWYMQQK